ncbi:MAG: ABC transporter substrate-binding protein [Acetobacteraceae bacterium]|nr:ABC transporter substrate-binding protein [Acetobacteraceae bacterium]
MKRRTVLAFPAYVAAARLGGGRSSAAEARTLQVVAPWEITSLDPSRAGFIFTRLSVAETLVGAKPDGALVPQLAQSWSVAADRLTWTFRLRSSARFHDGRPVTPADVAAALERAAALPGPLRAAPIAAISPTEGAVEIRTSRPFVSLPAFLAHSSTQILSPGSFAGGETVAVIGSGPYRTTKIEPPQRVEIAGFGGYDGTPPAVAAAAYLAASRAETRVLMAEAGQADLAFTIDPASRQRLRRNPRVTLLELPIPRVVTLKVNCAHPALSDPRARRALSAAIDRPGVARAILRNESAAATQLFPPALAEWHVPDLPPLVRDLATARGLLAELGWQPGPDGVLVRDGKPFALTLRTFPDRPELPLIAAALQDQLREVGIRVSVAVGNSGDIPLGHRDGTLELALLARNFALVPDPLGTVLQDFGPDGGDWGAMGWRHQGMQRTLEALSAAFDPAERGRLRGDVARILHAELPVVPIGWYDHSLAASRRVDGVVLDPLELSYHLPALRWT